MVRLRISISTAVKPTGDYPVNHKAHFEQSIICSPTPDSNVVCEPKIGFAVESSCLGYEIRIDAFSMSLL